MGNEGREDSANRDPLTGAPGTHPAGSGIGAVVGGLAGKGVAEVIDPTREDACWHEHVERRDYVEPGSTFTDDGPAYAHGVNARSRHPGRDFDDVEAELSSDREASRGTSRLEWKRARRAARDAWDRVTPSR